jgi:Uma2 family endonuclease
MSTTALESARETPPSTAGDSVSALHKFTVDEYHQMIDAGVFGKYDRVQLLEGRIVDKMTHKPRHDASVDLTQSAIAPLLPADWRIRLQSAVTTADSEPEPDIAVVRGPARRYSRRHPQPRDIGLIVEIGDATLRDDRTIQYRIYARSRFPVYWIVNLVDEKVEVYRNPKGGKKPRYEERRDYSNDESVPLVIAGKLLGTIPVRDLLP